jgi:hypothetical protein
MKHLLLDAIDWNSVKLGGISLLGFISGGVILAALSTIAVVSTIVSNSIRIYKEFKEKKK